MTRGRCGSLLLHRGGLTPPPPCWSPGAHANDPNVWTGGALQEKSVSWVFGLASMYPAFGWSSCAPGHHGCKRAFDLISCQASPGLFGSPVLECAGKTVAPSLPFSLADLGGEWVSRWHDRPFHASSSFVRSSGRSFIPTCAVFDGVVSRCCQGWPRFGPPEGLGLDNAERGARLTPVGRWLLTFS
jgi:hypothetical protein